MSDYNRGLSPFYFQPDRIPYALLETRSQIDLTHTDADRNWLLAVAVWPIGNEFLAHEPVEVLNKNSEPDPSLSLNSVAVEPICWDDQGGSSGGVGSLYRGGTPFTFRWAEAKPLCGVELKAEEGLDATQKRSKD